MAKLPKALLALGLVLYASSAQAFCGFYVAKADTKLFNKASKVVLVRDDGRTVVTMASDYQGDPKEFAMVVPVPSVIERKQVNVATPDLLDHLDAYSAPRVVEYFDGDPCNPMPTKQRSASGVNLSKLGLGVGKIAAKNGVTVEAEYTVGEYDIVVLSAKESDGLSTWLKQNGYKLPKGAGPILSGYIKRKMKFFVAKVNLKEKAKAGLTYLRPLQVAFESSRFDLPIRLGTLNADGPQELFVFALTKKGRVEPSNYRSAKIATGDNVPVYVKDEFPAFYRAMFDQQVKKDAMKAVYLEYAWDMGWCDPCAADPLTPSELRKLGVFWLPKGEDSLRGSGPKVFLTRLHLRYDAKSFPEDLLFQVTSDTNNFQGRYVLQHPWTGAMECPAADGYKKSLVQRFEKEAQTLAALTGWEITGIRRKMKLKTPQEDGKASWIDELWKD